MDSNYSKYKTLHHLNGAGQYSMSIPNYGLFNIPIQPARFYKFKKYKKINGFVLFRSSIQQVFAKNVGHGSRKAGKFWNAADPEFKNIFANIAREVTLQMDNKIEFKHFQAPKPKLNKLNNKSTKTTKTMKQEVRTGNRFQDDVILFSFTSNP
ncbi:unnamed protein product [Rhizophagus irregularis]|nr:unnamed protein product [Rhizophagus irregularis]CAB4444124.1 unnamed protein product [Rhizophagus irregularis]